VTRSLLRPRHAHSHARVTNIELFFDLVFAFAVTQLSHALLSDLSPSGAIHTLLLFLAVWWVWICTSWCTNWLDPERPPVRLLLLAMMLVGLVLSTAIPDAFGAAGPIFAGAYVTIQVGRTLFMLWGLGDASPSNTRNFQRFLVWLLVSAGFWLAGAARTGETRLLLWAVALGLEYLGPWQGFRVPGLGRSRTEDWDVEGGHLAERCSQFIIIALGESVLVTGATFGNLHWSTAVLLGFAANLIGSIAMWWIYFDRAVERGSAHIASSADPGRLARLAYTYVHLLIVAGIIVEAVSDDLVLVQPDGLAATPFIACTLGAPAVYLIGNILFKWPIAGIPPLSHLVGLVLLGLLIPFAWELSPLLLGAASSAALVVTAVWETVSLGRGAREAAK